MGSTRCQVIHASILLWVVAIHGLGHFLFSPAAEAQDLPPGLREEPFVAPPYTAPVPETPPARPPLIDNGDGTLTDPVTGLMWTRKDSYADRGECVNWMQAEVYVHQLATGGYHDWCLPTLEELATLYDPARENVLAWDRDPEYPMHLSDQFAPGAAYWYWTVDCGVTTLDELTCKTLYFVNGMVNRRRVELCNNGGVRAVRRPLQ